MTEMKEGGAEKLVKNRLATKQTRPISMYLSSGVVRTAQVGLQEMERN